jgi:hypothetical protein
MRVKSPWVVQKTKPQTLESNPREAGTSRNRPQEFIQCCTNHEGLTENAPVIDRIIQNKDDHNGNQLSWANGWWSWRRLRIQPMMAIPCKFPAPNSSTPAELWKLDFLAVPNHNNLREKLDKLARQRLQNPNDRCDVLTACWVSGLNRSLFQQDKMNSRLYWRRIDAAVAS